MQVAVLGTGEVGRTLAARFAADGDTVIMGSRRRDNPTAAAWVDQTDGEVSHGTFAEAAAGSQLVVNATAGDGSLEALASIPAASLDGVVLLDVANPLDFSAGFPPTLSVCNTTSLAEQIHQACPQAHVVKALNTMHNRLMVDPARVAGDHHVLLCGNHDAAKDLVRAVLSRWGWADEVMVDLGDITNARATEMLLPLWVRLYGLLGTPDFNFGIVR